MRIKTRLFSAIFLILILINLVLNNLFSNLKVYTREDSFSLTVFYLIFENKTLPSYCKLKISPLNKTINNCYGFFTINKLNNLSNISSIDLKALYKIKNKTIVEEKKIKFEEKKAYDIIPKELVLTGNNIITIITPYKGFLKIKNEVFQLNPGVNKVKITKFYPKGILPITLELCEERFCKTFKDFLIIKPSPKYCKIEIIKNNFPYYLRFNLVIKDQENKIYKPKVIYFDTKLLPYLKNNNYQIDFPIFYPAGVFDLKIYVDGRLCEKKVELKYDKFFYALSDEFQKKVGVSEVFLKNPYNKRYNITLAYNLNNLTKFENITLSQQIIRLKLPFSKYSIIYKNKTIYSFTPQIIKEKKFEKTIEYIRKTIFIMLLIIVFAFLFIYLIPYE